MKEKNYLWNTSSGIIAVLLVLPILAIFTTAVGETDELFSHLMSTVMPTYAYNTVVLVIGTMFLSLVFGIPSAWIMAMCRVPGERVLQWALVLPLAMPGYIVGYIFTDWFDFAGPVQVLLRDLTGWGPVSIGSRILEPYRVPLLFCPSFFTRMFTCCAARPLWSKTSPYCNPLGC